MFLGLLLRTSAITVDIDDWIRIRVTFRIQHHARFVSVLAQVNFQAMTVLSTISAVSASVLVHIAVRFQV